MSLWASWLVLTEQQAFISQGLHWEGRTPGLSCTPSTTQIFHHAASPLLSPRFPSTECPGRRLLWGGDPLWRRKVSNTVGSQEGAPARKCSHYNVIHSTLYGAPTFSNPGIFLGTRNHSENLSPDNGFGGKTNRKTKARSE